MNGIPEQPAPSVADVPTDDDLYLLIKQLRLSVAPTGKRINGFFNRMSAATLNADVLASLVSVQNLIEARKNYAHAIAERQLSPLAFSLIADVSVIASQLMDKECVDAETYLRKLSRDTAPKIATTRECLEQVGEHLKGEHLKYATELFISATDSTSFPNIGDNDSRSDAVYREIELRAARLLACQVAIAVALTSSEYTAVDWPPGQVTQAAS